MSEKILSRRQFLKAAALAGGAFGLAACGQKSTPQPTSEATKEEPVVSQPTAESASIRFWYYWGGFWGEAMAKLAETFATQNPSIKVESTSTGGEWQVVLAAFAAGNPPDVLLDFTGSQLMPRDQVLALDDFMAAGGSLQKDNYFPAMLDAFNWKGVQYGIPSGEAGVDMALIINKGLAAEAGLDINTPPQTLDEMLDWARKMTKQGDGGVLSQIGFDPLDGTIGAGFYNYGSVWGINWWDNATQTFNITKLVEPVQWLADWIKEYGVVNFEAFRAGFGAWLEPDSSICQGLQGMNINGYWTPGELFHKAKEGEEFSYTWVPVPANRKGKKVQSSLPTGGFLPKPAKSPEAAYKLLSFIGSDEANQITLDMAGGFAWTKSFLSKVDTSTYPGLDFYVKSISEADELYSNVQSCPLGWDFQFQQFLKVANAVIYDGKDPEEELKASQAACEEELAKLLRG